MKIHHYTSVETLALILSTRSIKLSSLSNVNDMDEGDTEDCGSIAHYFFVSCWTLEQNESIPLWNMYAGLGGIRITMEHDFLPKPNRKLVRVKLDDNISWVTKEYDDCEVEYSNNIEKLKPKIVQTRTVDFDMVGKVKREDWAFEKEWRIRRLSLVHVRNIALEHEKDLLTSNDGEVLPFKKTINRVEIKNYIRTEPFEKMEILLGPKISPGNKIIVNNLVEKYNPTAIIKESTLKIK